MADVFISYARADRSLATELHAHLDAQGVSTWWDTSLIGGESFRKKILSELQAATAVIVIWTETSVESDWVYDEANRAHVLKKLIPVRVASLDMMAVHPPFGALHTVLLDDKPALARSLAHFGITLRPELRSAKAEQPRSPMPAPTMRMPTGAFWTGTPRLGQTPSSAPSDRRPARGKDEELIDLVMALSMIMQNHRSAPFQIDDQHRIVAIEPGWLTGIAEKYLEIDDSAAARQHVTTDLFAQLAREAMLAHQHYRRDIHYIVKGGKIVVRDPKLGTLQHDARFPKGIQRAIEAKEHVEIT